MDFTLYWFMFPVGMMVATTAMLSGIGGAAFFTPIFLLIFPLLGPEYPLASPVTAIAVALLTETFGFSSGFIGYYRKRLIDFGLIKSFLIVSIPAGIVGTLMAHYVNTQLILLFYGLLMFIVAYVLIKGHGGEVTEDFDASDDLRKVVDTEGNVYQHMMYQAKKIPTAVGGLLTGLVSVGIGEVVMPQLVKDGKVAVPVAAATSVLIVIITVICASFTHIATLINQGGINAVPWNLVCYSIPGVLIGGQIGPRLQGKVPQRVMERTIAIIFSIIGVAMIFMVAKG